MDRALSRDPADLHPCGSRRHGRGLALGPEGGCRRRGHAEGDFGRGPGQSAAAQDKCATTIEDALVANRDLLPEIQAQAKKIAATRYLSTSSGETLQSSFPPTVDVYHELSMERTIVEVQARDQIGLLYRLAKTISDHGFDITFARIGTERGVAIDTFYIEGANHEPVSTPERLHDLRLALGGEITPSAEAPAATK